MPSSPWGTQRRARLSLACVASTTLVALLAGSAQAADSIVEAELMTPVNAPYVRAVSDSTASASKRLEYLGGGTSNRTVTSQAFSQIKLRVRGEQCSGAPRMVVRVDGAQVLDVTIPETAWVEKTATLAKPPGSHKFEVTFSNNYSSASCDRNLQVDKIDLVGGTAAPAPTPTPAPTPVPAPPAGSGSVLWGSGFEDGNLGVYKTVRKEGSGASGTHVISTARARTGTHSLKVTLPAATSGGTVGRYQLVANMPNGVKGQDRWYGFSEYLDNWNLNQVAEGRSYFANFFGFRWQGTTANGPGNNLDGIGSVGAPVFASAANLTGTTGATSWQRFGAVVNSGWTDWVVHIKWSTGTDGVREIWRDGVLVAQYHGSTMLYDYGFEHRIGLYEGVGVSQARTFFIDNHRVGTSYAAVDPTR